MNKILFSTCASYLAWIGQLYFVVIDQLINLVVAVIMLALEESKTILISLLSSVHLLVAPLRLMSACMWQVAQDRNVDQYDKLAEFITLVTEMVPELLNYKQRTQLILRLGARVSQSPGTAGKVKRMGVDSCLVDWISDYLSDRPQYVRLKDTTSDTVVSSTGAPQGTVLAPLLFTLYTSDFWCNTELCHIQKYADDTAIMGCIKDDRENSSTLSEEPTRTRKRKASPERSVERKRVKSSELEQPGTSSDDGEGPKTRKKKRNLRRRLLDQEVPSSSATTSRDTSSDPLEGCSQPKEGIKRKGADNEEAQRKKRRLQLVHEEEDRGKLSVDEQRVQFESKYEQQHKLGAGGCGSVFAGCRKSDNLPVAIKRVPTDKILCKHVDQNGKQLSIEVVALLKIQAGAARPAGTISLLDWYDLGQELILVLERPVPCEDLFDYVAGNGGSLEEEEAKVGCTPDHAPPEWHCQRTYRAGPATVFQIGVVLFDMLHRYEHFQTRLYFGNSVQICDELSEDCQDFLEKCFTLIPEQRPTLTELLLHPWLR
nr:PREDICTED: uncharacterized protein LOC103358119 [Stegastes partitus]